MSLLVVGLDLTVLNLALPSIANALHASTSHLQWFSDAYSLVLAAAVLPAGTLGDRYGRKRVLMTSLTIFGVSSAACAYAATSGELIAARAVLGLGAAAIMPLAAAAARWPARCWRWPSCPGGPGTALWGGRNRSRPGALKRAPSGQNWGYDTDARTCTRPAGTEEGPDPGRHP